MIINSIIDNTPLVAMKENDMSLHPYIFTLFNSPNCGAFLQSYALARVLESICGNRVSFVDTGARTITQNLASDLRYTIKHGDLGKIGFERLRLCKYSKVLESFQISPLRKYYSGNDLLVFGSDEIWNLSRPAMYRYPALWGSGFEGGHRISYAPSSNGANLKSSPVVADFVHSVSRFEALSARDAETANSVSELVGHNVEVVCDPTLLLSADDYRKIQICQSFERYLLLYCYGTSLTRNDIDEIRSFARRQKLKLVTAGTRLPWADINVPAGPLEFLGLMDGADFVVTDTFHGTVFSTIYGKRFASYSRGRSKTHSFLHSMGLEWHDPDVAGNLGSAIETDDILEDVNASWKDARIKSVSFLNEAVEAIAGTLSDQWKEDIYRNREIEMHKDVRLSSLTSVRIGGDAENLWIPKKGDDLKQLPKEGGKYRIISGGSNLLISDARTFHDVISMGDYDDSIEALGDGLYRVGASVRIQKLIDRINADGYGGIEELVSIPGMLGGLVYMNASVPSAGTCISDYLISVEVYNGERNETLDKDECGFGYRTSRFQTDTIIILSATFAFPPQSSQESARRVNARRERCKRLQDPSAPNFGSVFRASSRKLMNYVKKLGWSENGCSFSKKTSNWMLNAGGTYSDAITLIARVERLHKLFGKPCDPEVRIWD